MACRNPLLFSDFYEIINMGRKSGYSLPVYF